MLKLFLEQFDIIFAFVVFPNKIQNNEFFKRRKRFLSEMDFKDFEILGISHPVSLTTATPRLRGILSRISICRFSVLK